MQVKRLFITITVLFSLLLPSLSQARNVSIPDANLAAAIRQEIGNAITTDTLLNLKRLDARNRGIKALTGLEHAQNLEVLELGGEYIEGEGTVNSNTISDFTPLAALTNLKSLYLSNCSISDIAFLAKLTQLTYLNLLSNPVSDVSPLAGLTQLNGLYLYSTSISDVSALSGLTELTGLGISGSAVSDVSPLEGLTQLTYLYLEWNAISDISVLSGLTRLSSLHLAGNEISDVSPLEGLTQLTYLYLGWNAISDISALSSLTQLKVLDLRNNSILDVSALEKLNLTGTEWNSTGLYIERNPLSYAAIYRHIPAMKRKGIEVQFDSRTPTTLTKRLGDAQQAKPRTALATPLVVEVRDEKNIPFAGVPIYFTVTAGGGKVNPAETVSDATGRAETTLTLGSKLVENIVRVTATKTQQRVIFSATAVDNPPPTFQKPITFSVRENTTAVGTVNATDVDNQDRFTGYAVSPTAGEDSARFSITPKGDLRFKTAPDYERPTTASRSNVYIVLVSATSGTGDRARTGTQPFTITVTDVDEPPDRPAAPTVIPATPTSLIVSWAAPANTGPPMTYEVRYREGDTGGFTNANYNGRETNFTLSDLRRGRQYQVQVRAKNDEGTSDWSRLGIGTPNASPSIDFPDTALRAKVAEALDKRRNAAITALDLLALTELHARNANIRNLTGLEHAHNLRGLDLGGEYIEEEQRNSYNDAISDLSPLQGLTQLTWLDLSGTNVSNVSPLSGLTALTSLRLYGTPLSDVSPLAGLPQLRDLNLSSTPISDVSPLTGLAQLRDLHLSNTPISNVSPLAGLTQLRSLYLHSTSLSDIAALSSLTQLTHLGIGSSDIADLSPLEGLTQLVHLSFGGNAISDVSPLAGLTQLTQLYLDSNAISDVSPLAGLTQLEVLFLNYNAVLDVSPLVGLELPGTQWNSTGLYIEANPLSYTSINTHIPAMQAKGIEVKFDARVPTTLLKISDAAQEGVVNTALPLPFVVEVLDQKDRTFAGVPVKFAVTAGRGRLNATTVKTDAMGRAAAHLTLGRTEGTTTVRVTATDISEPVAFTATAILHSSLVMIPDTNLRMKIMETLRRPLDETPTASDMLKLTTLTANDADILDLTGLQHAAHLTRLSLENNRISNVSALAGLTQLTTLNLRNNWLSDVLPLVVLARLKGATDWNTLYLQGNPLSDISIDTRIPMLQAAGVNVRFDSISTQSRPTIRLIYFLPRDRQPQPDINAQMDRLIKEVQQFFKKQMEKYGVGRKTFQFETDAHGNAVVYHVNGKFDDVYYHDDSNIVWREIREQFDTSKNIYLTALDVSTASIGVGERGGVCGTGGGGNHSGSALIPASGGCFGFSTTAHELGHAFGLQHDFRDGAYIMSYGAPKDRISQCAAEWLDVHRAFNASQATANESAAGNWSTIEMLPPSRSSSLNAIRFRFKVDDSDGLHQAQLHTETLSGLAKGSSELIDYKPLSGNSGSTVEFVTTYLGPENKSVSLQVIDKNGNMSGSERYSIDVASLLSPSEVISIPDANLAAAIREEIGGSITTHTLLHLTRLYAPNQGITDLTGLEHAHNLRVLNLRGEYIEGRLVNSNAISDVTPLVTLTNLRALDLSNCSLSDIAFLAELPQLTSLDLSGNPISNVSPLAALAELGELHLRDTSVSDISVLSRLTQLSNLDIAGTSVSDISPLAALTELTQLDLGGGNNISDISVLSGLTELTQLYLGSNNISDISPLEDLTQLTYLDLGWNAISDISALSGLMVLTSLDLRINKILDVSPLSGLTQLTYLHLDGNAISDISALSDMTQLKVLNLNRNSILDVSPLIELDLPGTEWESTGLRIKDNPLSYASIHTHIPAMQAKGVEVKFDSRAPTRLVKISGAGQQGVVNAALPLPFIVEVQDERNQGFAGVPVTFSVATGGGKLSVTTVPTDAAGRASAHLTLGRAAGTATVRVAAAEISQPVVFTATGVLLSAPVTISDAVLHTVIASALGKSENSNFTVSDMLKLTTLTANSADIRDLTGLEQASNLTALSLNGNTLSDIAPLTGLSKLTTLSLNNNRISDVAPLEALAELQTLSVENNNLVDVTPLSGLTQLETLSLGNNRLRNVSAFIGLSELRTLSLNNNDLSDIAPLTSLRRLKTLELNGNLLSYPSLHTHISALQARGATVRFDPRTPTVLVNISGTHGVVGTAHPIGVEVQDAHGFGFSGVPVTFTVTAGGGQLSASNVIADNTGRARTTLTLGPVSGKNTIRATAAEVLRPVSFSITAVDANSRVIVRDANLRTKIIETLGKAQGVQLTAGDMLGLTQLDARNANIQNLTGLEHAHNLTSLNLSSEYIAGEGTVNSNTISDFAPIAGLTRLTRLNLSDCGISDASFVSGLTQLTWLHLGDNTISDISPLANLKQLGQLYLWHNTISDVTPLAALKKLTWLMLSNNTISDVSPLAELKQLPGLGLGGNAISDISALAGLTQLTNLSLWNNTIGDVSPLKGLTQLTDLHLSGNAISDISALAGLTQLKSLNLRGNAISDVSPLVELNLTGTEWDSTGLYIEHNPLNYASVHTHIPAMQARGVEVKFDNKAHSVLVKISGDTQESEVRTTLVTPFVVQALDPHGTAITGLSVTFRVIEGGGSLIATAVTTDAQGRARTRLSLGPDPGVNKVRVTAPQITYPVTFTAIATAAARHAADVNGDRIVNVQDLVLVSSRFGQTGQSRADVNGDGVVNIQDLVRVAGALGQGTAASPPLHASDLEGLTAADIQQMLLQARQLARTDPAYLRGIAVLEQLLALLLPKETALFPNYPNPFNPETWIPYQLAKPSEVTLHIYTVNGRLVRVLVLGHQSAGRYQSRSRAAYWDGRNSLGETVASGVYFYTLTAGDFTATRKMLIRK